MNEEVKRNLEYVNIKIKNISTVLLKEMTEESKCEFLNNEIADILSNLNKCYDYCSTDLIESQDFTNLSDKDKKKFDRCNKYFPTNVHVLENSIYKYVKIVNLKLYNQIYALMKRISNNEQVQTNEPNTYSDLKYGMVKDIRKLCNDDKHHCSLKVCAFPNTKAYVKRADGSSVEISTLNCSGNYPPFSIPIGENGSGYIGNSYTIEGYNEEVERFLILRAGITKKVLEEVYSFIN